MKNLTKIFLYSTLYLTLIGQSTSNAEYTYRNGQLVLSDGQGAQEISVDEQLKKLLDQFKPGQVVMTDAQGNVLKTYQDESILKKIDNTEQSDEPKQVEELVEKQQIQENEETIQKDNQDDEKKSQLEQEQTQSTQTIEQEENNDNQNNTQTIEQNTERTIPQETKQVAKVNEISDDDLLKKIQGEILQIQQPITQKSEKQISQKSEKQVSQKKQESVEKQAKIEIPEMSKDDYENMLKLQLQKLATQQASQIVGFQFQNPIYNYINEPIQEPVQKPVQQTQYNFGKGPQQVYKVQTVKRFTDTFAQNDPYRNSQNPQQVPSYPLVDLQTQNYNQERLKQQQLSALINNVTQSASQNFLKEQPLQYNQRKPQEYPKIISLDDEPIKPQQRIQTGITYPQDYYNYQQHNNISNQGRYRVSFDSPNQMDLRNITSDQLRKLTQELLSHTTN